MPAESGARRIGLLSQLGWIHDHWKPYRREVPLLVVLSVINAALLVVQPLFIQRVVDSVAASGTMRPILSGVGLLALVGLVHFGLYLWLQGSRARLNIRFDYGVRQRGFEHVLRMGPGFFRRFRTGDIVTRLTDDVSDKLSWFMCSGLFRLIEASILIVFGLVMMLHLDEGLTLYTAGPLPILIAIFFLTATRLDAHFRAVQASISRMNDSLETVFSGIRVVKAFASEHHQREEIARRVDAQRAAELGAVRWQSVIDSLWGHIWQFAIVGVLLAGGLGAMRGEITIGQLVAFQEYVLLLVFPMFDVGQFLVRGRVSAVSVSRVSELELSEPDVTDRHRASPEAERPDATLARESLSIPTSKGGIVVRFEGVRYGFPDAVGDVLAGVSFDATPGTLTAVAGEVGSGKTTLLALVPRLLEVTGGAVLVDGRDVREWPTHELRAHLGWVPQEPLLFSTTVRENVHFGREWIGDDDVEHALDAAGLRPDLTAWPRGVETPVGARGLRLSGGQKQRVALARALVARPDVLLLDDCTSSLDAETEARVWSSVFADLPRCTTIVVTHRRATLERADQIVFVDRGRVAGIGRFAELNRPGTRFSEVYQHLTYETR